MTLAAACGADNSRDYYPLTYRDPTGETAVRNLMGRSVQILWESGGTINLDIEEIRPFLAQLDYRMSRKGHIWAKKKPRLHPGPNQNQPLKEED